MISIMTWNTALTEGSNADDVLAFVKNFVDKEDSVAVLQQIPYKDPEKDWKEHEIYIKILGMFPSTIYKLYHNKTENNGYIFMSTIIISKMDNVKESPLPVTNRESAIVINDSITIYGIHAKNGIDNKKYLQSINGVEADIILGDFNAGDYEECQNKSIFRSILKNYVCICNMPSKVCNKNDILSRRTCIDHIFVTRKMVSRCSNLIIHEDIKISDHYPITFEII